MTDPRLELLPAVDVADGQAVRLVQGEAGSETSYGDPLSAALDWHAGGAEWIHLVDLDAAFGRGSNAALLGASMALLSRSRRAALEALVRRVEHVRLETHPHFFEFFVEGCQMEPFGSAVAKC